MTFTRLFSYSCISILTLLVIGCSSGQGDDLDKFMADAGKGMSTAVPPLPQVKPYEPLQYNADKVLSNPFKSKKVSGKLAPNLNRPRQPLEAYPLESLKYVGSISKHKLIYALIKAPDNSVQQLKLGSYLGTNYGLVTKITESALVLKELVLDQASGDWVEQTTTMNLQE